MNWNICWIVLLLVSVIICISVMTAALCINSNHQNENPQLQTNTQHQAHAQLQTNTHTQQVNQVNTKPIVIFWHIYIPPLTDRSDAIVQRQFSALKESGLLDACVSVYVGLVCATNMFTDTINEILKHPKIHIINRVLTGNEDVTSCKLKEFADNENETYNILYFHSRGVTHDPMSVAGLASDDWTKMMEFFVIHRWKESSSYLTTFKTAGCEMWSHAHRVLNNVESWHYSGNFWWARSDYIKLLNSPIEFGYDRFLVCEDWILQLAGSKFPITDFGVLHYTARQKYNRGIVHSYIDRYPPNFYQLGNETPDIYLDCVNFHGEKDE